ncbi:TolC family protein [Orbus sturtevantii]|uniref:TolC family protein n=1 Tax=Orbus sturtevantii TaxID=3074109 RepID=UPI00370DD74D
MKNSTTSFSFLKYKLYFSIFCIITLVGCVTSNDWQDMPVQNINSIVVHSNQAQDNNELSSLFSNVDIIPNHKYSLVELIDLSQNNNVQLRSAWQQAKQAALTSNIIKTTFLPNISANIIGGYQKNSFDLTDSIHVDTRTKEVIPNLTLQWLVFDFGQRSDLLGANEHLVSALKYNFNLANQKFVYQVTLAYLNYSQAVRELTLSEQELSNTLIIQDSVKKKRIQGLATIVDVAQAEQLVAQSKLDNVVARNNQKNTYQLLLQAMGLSPLAGIDVKIDDKRQLPTSITPVADQWIKTALVSRPDILASYEVVKTKQANIDAAKKNYYPKVFVAANLSSSHSYWGAQSLPDLSQTSNGTNIFFGVHIPIYDAGARNIKVEQAKSQALESIEQFNNLKNNAANEIVIAANTLNSALESYQSALSLVKTANITYSASLSSYEQGLATLTLVNESARNLTYAKKIESQTYFASLIAASNLSFILGFTINSDIILDVAN